MHLEIHYNRCELNGICVGIAPDLLDIDDDELTLTADPVPGEHLDAARQAVAQCPRSALSLGGLDS